MAPFFKQELSTGWEFKLTNDTSPDAWLPVARVPSVVHMDLRAHNKIPDAALDLNELDVQWVGEANWSYRCSHRIHLVFEGLDTFATVYLNGEQILECDNMFVAHRVDVTASLRHVPAGAPSTLQIDFQSAVARGREVVAAHPGHQYVGTLGSAERMAVRKAQYHWGWDWGPALVTAGPWRPVRLEMFDSRIDDVAVRYALSPSLKYATGTITTRVRGVTAGTRVKTRLYDPKGAVVFALSHDVDLTGTVLVQFDLTAPLLWNPHGYGEQHLYKVEVELLSAGSVAVHTAAKRVGLRAATLVTEDDAFGTSFYFRVNNVDIFAGGSCWIPADMLPPRVTAADYRAWLGMMVEGRQIMTRVWGGGYYEDDAFYNICDELGVLVWQDFMFACGSYPADQAFLQSVEAEARQQLQRLAHHPAIVLYAGGNENHFIQEHCALEYDWDDKDPQSWLRTSFPSRYIYQHLLPTIVAQEAPAVCYRPDSPWNDGRPIMSWDQTRGDLHQWKVWHADMRLYQDFGAIGGRFNSEFGMQSLPHLATIAGFVTDAAERHPQSATLDYHNKCRDHEKRLATYMRDNFRGDDASLPHWVYLSHLLQSEAVHYAYRSWRRDWGVAGARRCGGALVWQLNDLWPVTSWALVDSGRLRKAAFYAIRRDLAPVAVGVVRTHHDWTLAGARPPATSMYDVWVACDGSTATTQLLSKGGSLEVELRFVAIHTGRDVLPAQRHRIASSKVAANGTTPVVTGVSLANPSTRDEAFVIAAKVSAAAADGHVAVLARDVDWPQPFKHLSFRNSRGLQICRQAAEVGGTRLTITAGRPTKGLIFTEQPGLHFSDNGFDVVPGEEYTVQVDGLGEHDVLEWTYLGMDESRRPVSGSGNIDGPVRGHL
ncbi:hypothetical protein SCUCBS95973_002310 [Sporothrix curviconia]|uniref:beta-mannosidase n=1 Tax=Sporothrix curviconia TaxID=1260050 RepID=A0ABP0B6K9_9PEZI